MNNDTDITRHLAFFHGILTDSQLMKLAGKAVIKSFGKNEPVYREGETPENFMCIVSGKVKVYKKGLGDKAQILNILGEHSCLGYRAYFAGEPYKTGATAMEKADILMIPMLELCSMMQENSRLGMFFVHDLAVSLGRTETRILNLTQKHLRGRLAETLLMLKESYGYEHDGRTLAILTSREDLGSMSNMTTANAIKTLSSFSSENIVRLDGKRIMILDEKMLVRISAIG